MKNLLISIILLINIKGFSQDYGNKAYFENRNYSDLNASAYGNRATTGSPISKNQTLYLIGDSVIYINAKILMNTIADQYLVVMALHQEERTVKACNLKINERIDGFKAALNKNLNIMDKAIYTDLITFNKVYNYKTVGKESTQYQCGFELKKNLIVQISDIQNLESILEYAAEFEIYDFVKVDYISTQKQQFYNQMSAKAEQFITDKKNSYMRMSHFELDSTYIISQDQFYSISPYQLYQSYAAFETSSVSYRYNSNYRQNNTRKSQTHYYDRPNYSNFDIVINPADPRVNLEYVLEMQFKFYIKKKEQDQRIERPESIKRKR
jgi:uncharacterized protein YggE